MYTHQVLRTGGRCSGNLNGKSFYILSVGQPSTAKPWWILAQTQQWRSTQLEECSVLWCQERSEAVGTRRDNGTLIPYSTSVS